MSYLDRNGPREDMTTLSALFERLGDFEPATPEQEARARATVERHADAGGWDAGEVLAALGIGGTA